MLTFKEIDQIRAGRWEIDCSEITLTGRGGAARYQGPGSLRQMPTGRLGFKLYGDVSGSKLFAFGSGAAGEIIPDSEFYDLHALDVTGHVWTSEHFLVHEHGTVDGSRSVFTGELWRLVHRYEFRGSAPETVVLRSFQDLEIPFNSATITQTAVAGMEPVQAFNTNASRFPACGMQFVLTRDVSGLVVTISTAEAALPAHIETRFEEALQFVLAHPVAWTIIEKSAGKNGSVELRALPEREIRPPRAEPPISFRHVLAPDEVWQMCARYLAHVLPYEPPEGRVWYHPLSDLVHAVLEASKASIDAEALELSVAVEGLLNQEFPDLGHPTAEMAAELDRALTVVSQSDLSPDVKKRIDGAVRAMKKPSAKDKLRELVKAGAITKEQVGAWDDLRNPSSHGVRAHERELQDVVDLCGRVLVLFYHLIFWRIAYRGRYTDYGTKSWPTAEYRPENSSPAVQPSKPVETPGRTNLLRAANRLIREWVTGIWTRWATFWPWRHRREGFGSASSSEIWRGKLRIRRL